MATFKLSLSEKTDINAESEILIRVSFSREQRYRIKSNLFFAKKNFLKNKISIPRIETAERTRLVELDLKLRSLLNFILEKYYEKSDKNAVSKKWLDDTVKQFYLQEETPKTETKGFFDVFEECVKYKRLSDNRESSYMVQLNLLKLFEKYKQTTDRKFVLSFENITASMIYEIV